MNLYLKLTISTFTIWILASFINGLFYGIYEASINHIFNAFPVGILVVFFISLFFSAPGFFIFWIILMGKLGRGIYERALFRAALSTGFLLAATTAIVCLELLKSEFSTDKYAVVPFTVLSSTTSIMMHFNHFKRINKPTQ